MLTSRTLLMSISTRVFLNVNCIASNQDYIPISFQYTFKHFMAKEIIKEKKIKAFISIEFEDQCF